MDKDSFELTVAILVNSQFSNRYFDYDSELFQSKYLFSNGAHSGVLVITSLNLRGFRDNFFCQFMEDSLIIHGNWLTSTSSIIYIYFYPDGEKLQSLSERLTSLGIMGEQLTDPLEPLNCFSSLSDS